MLFFYRFPVRYWNSQIKLKNKELLECFSLNAIAAWAAQAKQIYKKFKLSKIMLTLSDKNTDIALALKLFSPVC